MKKLILLKLTCFILILNTNLYAQEFKFGLVGGLDIANSRLTNKPDIYSRVFYPGEEIFHLCWSRICILDKCESKIKGLIK